MDFGVGLLELVEAVRVAVAGPTHVRAATLVVRGAEKEHSIVWEFHAHGARGILPIPLL